MTTFKCLTGVNHATLCIIEASKELKEAAITIETPVENVQAIRDLHENIKLLEDQMFLRDHNAGMTPLKIAAKYGVTAARVNAIVKE